MRHWFELRMNFFCHGLTNRLNFSIFLIFFFICSFIYSSCCCNTSWGITQIRFFLWSFQLCLSSSDILWYLFLHNTFYLFWALFSVSFTVPLLFSLILWCITIYHITIINNIFIIIAVYSFLPVYNGPSVAIRPSVCALVVLFLYTLKWLSSSLFYIELMFLIYNTRYQRQNFMEKYNKISSKMYKNLVRQIVQQKVQQKMCINYVALLIKRFVFTKLAESLY